MLTLYVKVHTCVMCGGICPGHRADDVEVLEKSYATWRSEVGSRPAQSLHSSDGDPGLAGLQHHHHRINVGDGDTSVFTKTPGDRETKEGEVRRVRIEKNQTGYAGSGLVFLFLDMLGARL